MDRHVLAAVSLGGGLFDVLGALYLAYELLGGSKGPLGTLTRWVSYTLLFAVVYGLVLGPAFGFIAGPALGLALAIEMGKLPTIRSVNLMSRVIPFGLWRGMALGISAALVSGLMFGSVFGLLSAVGLLLSYLVGSSPAQVHLEDPRPGITWPRVRATAARGLAVGVSALLAGQVAGQGVTGALGFAVKVGLVVSVVGGLLAAVVPLVEAWVEQLPPRRLGAFGVVLLLLGMLLQSLQHWLLIFDVPVF